MFGTVVDHQIFDFHDTIHIFEKDIHIEAVKFDNNWFIVKELQTLFDITNTEIRVARRKFPDHFKVHTPIGLICTDYIARHFAMIRGRVIDFITNMRFEMIALRSQYEDIQQDPDCN